MILYHGTTLEIRQPVIVRSEIGRDFGFAFYTTDIEEQARRWARRRARMLSRRSGRAEAAVVNVYAWHEDAGLAVRRFDGASLEWLDMVVRCRRDPGHRHGYDVVIGKIANDNVGETVSFVAQGIMRREDALERLRFERINNQIALCSEAALATLVFQRSFVVED